MERGAMVGHHQVLRNVNMAPYLAFNRNEEHCGEASWKCTRLANPVGRYYGIIRQIRLQKLFNDEPLSLSWVCFMLGVAVGRIERLGRLSAAEHA